ncbi:MAG: hypothetical protein EA401_07545 [Planctomycetota bacterium]|nr:MAG: hypothetical protein EA401_07545 [Planctomycetota bacterium]
MTSILDHLFDLIRLEDLISWGWLGCIGLLLAGWGSCAGILVVTSYLHKHKWSVAYTRKILHLALFLVAMMVLLLGGRPALFLWGTGASVVLVAILLNPKRGPAFWSFVRVNDTPYEILHTVVPYLATVIGGVITVTCFGEHASVAGLLVAGLGDAVGEPVGTALGRHRYRVWSLTAQPVTRSWEGSAAVLLVSWIVIGVFLLASGVPNAWIWAFGIAVASAVAEGISPHGTDNALLQVIPSSIVAELVHAYPMVTLQVL